MVDPRKPLILDSADLETVKQQNNSTQRGPTPASWKPGQSGNPNGRPKKGYSISEAFKRMLEADPEKKEAIVNKILLAALSGDMAAAKMIWQYMDGQPAQAIDLTSNGEQIKTPTHFIPVEKDEKPYHA